MSDTPTGFVPTEIPPRVAGLGFTFLRPGDWTVAALPEETVDFEQPATFLPLCVAHATYAALVFSVGARPAYPDGTVSEWLQWLVGQQGFDPGPIEAEAVGGHAAVACWAMQTQGDVVMRMRIVLLEDGGRLEVDGQPIEQAFLLGDAPGQNFLVVRATASPQGITQAMDLAEVLLRDLRFLDPAA